MASPAELLPADEQLHVEQARTMAAMEAPMPQSRLAAAARAAAVEWAQLARLASLATTATQVKTATQDRTASPVPMRKETRARDRKTSASIAQLVHLDHQDNPARRDRTASQDNPVNQEGRHSQDLLARQDLLDSQATTDSQVNQVRLANQDKSRKCPAPRAQLVHLDRQDHQASPVHRDSPALLSPDNLDRRAMPVKTASQASPVSPESPDKAASQDQAAAATTALRHVRHQAIRHYIDSLSPVVVLLLTANCLGGLRADSAPHTTVRPSSCLM